MRETVRGILSTLLLIRRTGQTTTLAGVAKMNPKAVIIVGNQSMKRALEKDHNLPQNQVRSIHDFTFLRGLTNIGPILFDTTAIVQLLGDVDFEMNIQDGQIQNMRKDLEAQEQQVRNLKIQVLRMSEYHQQLEDQLERHGITPTPLGAL